MSKPDEDARKYAMRLLGGRDYGRNELAAKLSERFSHEEADAAVEAMCEYGYVNDTRYADKLAAKYITVNRYGKSRAALMMRKKLLGPETIRDALGKYDREDMTAEIAVLLRKKYYDRLFLEGMEGKKERQKVVAALARRGYGLTDIKAALREVMSGLDNEEE